MADLSEKERRDVEMMRGIGEHIGKLFLALAIGVGVWWFGQADDQIAKNHEATIRLQYEMASIRAALDRGLAAMEKEAAVAAQERFRMNERLTQRSSDRFTGADASVLIDRVRKLEKAVTNTERK